MALIIKFIANYFFHPVDYPEIPKRNDPSNDSYLFNQHTGGLSKIKFPDYRKAYEGLTIPNVLVFREQVELFKKMLIKTPPTKDQTADIDYMLSAGELFTLIAYAQLILENAKIYRLDDDILNEIFKFIIKDFSGYAMHMVTNYENTPEQEHMYMQMFKKPILDKARFERVWDKYVYALKDQYVMNA